VQNFNNIIINFKTSQKHTHSLIQVARHFEVKNIKVKTTILAYYANHEETSWLIWEIPEEAIPQTFSRAASHSTKHICSDWGSEPPEISALWSCPYVGLWNMPNFHWHQ